MRRTEAKECWKSRWTEPRQACKHVTPEKISDNIIMQGANPCPHLIWFLFYAYCANWLGGNSQDGCCDGSHYYGAVSEWVIVSVLKTDERLQQAFRGFKSHRLLQIF